MWICCGFEDDSSPGASVVNPESGINERFLWLSLVSSVVAPVPAVAVPPVSPPVMAVTPPVSAFTAAPGAASAVSAVTAAVAPASAVAPPTAAPAPVSAGAGAPAAVAAPSSAAVAGAPPPSVMAGASSSPAVAGGAFPPLSATGAPLSVGAVSVPFSKPAVPALHHLLPLFLPAFLPIFPSPPVLHSRFRRLLLFALRLLHSIHHAQDPQHHTVTWIRGPLLRHWTNTVLFAWRSFRLIGVLLQQVAEQSLPQLFLLTLELQGALLLRLHSPQLLLLLASAGLQVLKTSEFLLLSRLLLPLLFLPFHPLFLQLFLLLGLKKNRKRQVFKKR